MPQSILSSPIDGSPMRKVRRYGIEIDICPSSGGVWLDKGELEKLLQMCQDDMAEDHMAMRNDTPRYKHDDDDHDDHYDDDDERRYRQQGYYGSGKHHKKKGKMSRLMDMFDL